MVFGRDRGIWVGLEVSGFCLGVEFLDFGIFSCFVSLVVGLLTYDGTC